MSPDEENLYVAGGEADTLVVFDRAAGSGALQPAGCFRRPGASTACGGEAARLNGPNSVVVTPDGRNVYVDGYDAASIVEFSRAAGGNHALTPIGCLGTAPCSDRSHGVVTGDLSLSHDGRTLTSSSDVGGVMHVIAREPATGRLTAAGCIAGGHPRCRQPKGVRAGSRVLGRRRRREPG